MEGTATLSNTGDNISYDKTALARTLQRPSHTSLFSGTEFTRQTTEHQRSTPPMSGKTVKMQDLRQKGEKET